MKNDKNINYKGWSCFGFGYDEIVVVSHAYDT